MKIFRIIKMILFSSLCTIYSSSSLCKYRSTVSVWLLNTTINYALIRELIMHYSSDRKINNRISISMQK